MLKVILTSIPMLKIILCINKKKLILKRLQNLQKKSFGAGFEPAIVGIRVRYLIQYTTGVWLLNVVKFFNYKVQSYSMYVDI